MVGILLASTDLCLNGLPCNCFPNKFILGQFLDRRWQRLNCCAPIPAFAFEDWTPWPICLANPRTVRPGLWPGMARAGARSTYVFGLVPYSYVRMGVPRMHLYYFINLVDTLYVSWMFIFSKKNKPPHHKASLEEIGRACKVNDVSFSSTELFPVKRSLW